MPLVLGNLELLATNVGFTVSAVLTICLGFFVLFKNPRKAEHIIFFLMSMAATTFLISHLWGINLTDPDRSHFAFMFDVSAILILAFNTHLILAVTNRFEKQKAIMVAIYVIAFSLIVLFVAFPNLYLHASKSIMYFPNYYARGPLYPLQTTFVMTVMAYLLYHLYRGYLSSDHIQRNRLWYFVVAFTFAYTVGIMPLFPIYGINLDPIFSLFSGLWTVPIAYGILKQNLMDIRVMARHALTYLILVIASTAVLVAINLSNIILLQNYPGFPLWIIPSLSSVLGIALAIMIWVKAKESDVLKYEFVKIVTHKFRTPLTHIKLSLEELRSAHCDTIASDSIERIEIANNHLLELTNTLMETAKAEDASHFYQFKIMDLNDFLHPILNAYKKEIAAKHLSLVRHCTVHIAPVSIDPDRMESVFQILLENAVEYSRTGGIITVSTEVKGKEIMVSIADEGIGMSQSDLPLIFRQFFRSRKAVSVDTEGMGLGLFIAKRIVEKHGGTVWAKSPGENQGSTFFVSLPVNRHSTKKILNS